MGPLLIFKNHELMALLVCFRKDAFSNLDYFSKTTTFLLQLAENIQEDTPHEICCFPIQITSENHSFSVKPCRKGVNFWENMCGEHVFCAVTVLPKL